MNRAAIVRGLGRADRYDYPLDVIRELAVNALMHRDYSSDARGAQVQIEIYPDRLEVKSPGGLHGPITPDVLGTVDQRSTSRNGLLASLLSGIQAPNGGGEMLCENRGSGLRAVMDSLQRAGMSPPEFRVDPGAVDVVVPRHSLLADDVLEWIASLEQPDLSDQRRIALAMMRSAGTTSNARLRTWGMDMQTASQSLRDLVNRGLAVKSGGKRYATYRLSEDIAPPPYLGLQGDLDLTLPKVEPSDVVIAAIKNGHITTRAIATATDLEYRAVLRRIERLVDDGRVERTGPRNSPHVSYRTTAVEQEDR